MTDNILDTIQARGDWAFVLFRKGDVQSNTSFAPYKLKTGVELLLPTKWNPLKFVKQVAQVVSVGEGVDKIVTVGQFVVLHHFVAGQPQNVIEIFDNGDQLRKVPKSQIWAAINNDIIIPVQGQVYCEFKEQKVEFLRVNSLIDVRNMDGNKNKAWVLKVKHIHPLDQLEFGITIGDEILVDSSGAYDIEITGKKFYKIDTLLLIAQVQQVK